MFSLKPIASFKTQRRNKYDCPRQGAYETSEELGEILIESELNFAQCTHDLQGFSHIWLLYAFHQAQNWKPMVQPPTSEKKRGVFATRAPHRPNPIGLSCVELVEVRRDRLVVKSFDLLDGTPILDIKPYVTRYDSIPLASEGWLAEPFATYTVEWSEVALEQAVWIEKNCDWNLRDALERNLRHKPFDKSHKRFARDGESLIYSMKTWRIRVREVAGGFLVEDVFPGAEIPAPI